MADSYFKQKAHENRRAINILFHTYWLFKVIVNVELNVGVGTYIHCFYCIKIIVAWDTKHIFQLLN